MVKETLTGFDEIIKCIIVGDSGVGKTCLTCSYACNTKYDLQKLVKTYQASVWAIDHYRHDKEILDRSWSDIDGCQVSLRLWDTFGYHDKDRRFAYRGADVVVLCFSVLQPNSLLNVRKFWHPEIRRFCPTTPIILCGTQADLRYLCFDEKYINMEKGLLYRNILSRDLITPNEGREVAKEIGAPYYETSVLTHYGIEDVFVNASRVALIEHRKIKFWNTQLRRIQQPLVQAPMKMPAPAIPQTTIPNALLKSDISAVLNNKSECDVTFLLHGQTVEAHKICLAVASKFFYDLFTVIPHIRYPAEHINSQHISSKFPNRFSLSDSEKLLDSDNNSTDTECDISVQNSAGDDFLSAAAECFLTDLTTFPIIIPYDHKAIELIEIRYQPNSLDRNKSLRTYVRLNEDISPKSFEVVVEYLYTGSLRPCGVDIEMIRKVAELFQLTNLMVVVDNIRANQEFLNIEKDKQFHESRVARLRGLVLNNNFLSDITFEVDNGMVSAHKALLMGRCEMMYAMFNSDFKESSSDVIPFPGITEETFCALKEYLYTGESPCLSGVDCVTLIEVANRLCLPRLVNMVEASVITQLQTYDKDEMLQDVLILLEPAELYNATQLSAFCEYTLSTNYYEVIKRHQSLFRALPQEKQDAIEKKRWPPIWYINEVEHYDRLTQSSHFGKQSIVQDYNRRCGCLCFTRRGGRNRFRDPMELPSG